MNEIWNRVYNHKWDILSITLGLTLLDWVVWQYGNDPGWWSWTRIILQSGEILVLLVIWSTLPRWVNTLFIWGLAGLFGLYMLIGEIPGVRDGTPDSYWYPGQRYGEWFLWVVIPTTAASLGLFFAGIQKYRHWRSSFTDSRRVLARRG